MKHSRKKTQCLVLCLAFIALLLTGCAGENNEQPGTSGPSVNRGETVLFFDDFDADELDDSRWTCEEGYLRSGLQKHTADRVTLEDGYLVLAAHREDNWEFTSGSVHTAGKFEFGPGVRLEVRAKLEGGLGAWPAIWAHASRFTPQHPTEVWPAGGELDLMEAYPPEEGFETTIHYLNEEGNAASMPLETPDASPEEWHTYGLIWTWEELSFTLDGAVYATVATDKFCTDAGMYPFADDINALFLHLSLAIQYADKQGNSLETGDMPENMRFLVDWVQVTSLEEPKDNWVAFSQDEFVIDRYEVLPLIVYTNPEAQDRTVRWQVENEWVLLMLDPNHVKGNLYGDHSGTSWVIITTPSGNQTSCDVTVQESKSDGR